MLKTWIIFGCMVVLVVTVYCEVCPNYCDDNSIFMNSTDCGPEDNAYCCGTYHTMYCCVHYNDRIPLDVWTNITAEDCKVDSGQSSIHNYGQLIQWLGVYTLSLVTARFVLTL